MNEFSYYVIFGIAFLASLIAMAFVYPLANMILLRIAITFKPIKKLAKEILNIIQQP